MPGEVEVGFEMEFFSPGSMPVIASLTSFGSRYGKRTSILVGIFLWFERGLGRVSDCYPTFGIWNRVVLTEIVGCRARFALVLTHDRSLSIGISLVNSQTGP